MTKRTMLAAACLSVCIPIGSRVLAGDEPLRLSVSPVVALAPCEISVRAIIESSDENRLLEITAQSSEFSRSSTIELNGRHAPRVAVFDYRDLPVGLYEVSGLLVGPHGTRAAVTKIVRVIGR